MTPLLAAVLVASLAGAQEDKPRKIVLLAGPLDAHPKDTHEYERSVFLLKHCLLGAPGLKNVRVDVHLDGWPDDPAALDGADTIFLASAGADRHPFLAGDRLAAIGKLMDRGCGLVLFHGAAVVPPEQRDRFAGWAGATIAAPEHPVARGVRPFPMKREPALPCDEGSVGFAVERKDGGRGFRFTGGHAYADWWNRDFRKLVLNAIAWTAKLEVPAEGVESTLEDPVRVTILTGHHYPAHEWKITTPAFIQVVERDPRVQVAVTEDLQDLTKLDGRHVLVINYMNWGKPGLTDEQKRALAGFFERGGGLVVFHGATGVWNSSICPRDSHWAEFAERITARYWDSKSGHDDFGPFRVENVAPDHEITRGLPAFDTRDELYVRLGGKNGTPLVAADSKVAGGREPLAWAHAYGKGRVFVTALGHGIVSIHSAGALFRRATVWAAGAPPLAFDPPAVPTGKAAVRPGTWEPRKD